jgi:hypothetical protein
MTVTADGRDEATDKLITDARRHLSEVHPEIQKSDEEIRNDVDSNLETTDGMPSDML